MFPFFFFSTSGLQHVIELLIEIQSDELISGGWLLQGLWFCFQEETKSG